LNECLDLAHHQRSLLVRSTLILYRYYTRLMPLLLSCQSNYIRTRHTSKDAYRSTCPDQPESSRYRSYLEDRLTCKTKGRRLWI